MIDVSTQINAVSRQVGRRALEAGEARTVIVQQTFDSTIEDVWDAVTNIERIPRWLMPITGDLRLGGHYQLEGNAGGTIETCDPPKGFTATWEFDGGMSWIEVALMPAEGGTQVRVEHIAEVDDATWDQFGPGAVGIGWDLMFMGLALHLSTGAANDPEGSMAWQTSAEGLEFMNRGNEAWCEANIAAGTPEAVARASAERTFAAYSGAPEEPPAE
ncbi:MAG: polyketide cyclase [Streptosporangiales bacterium]|nr:polyketide cyclase [Streptosporangiales bacterium]